MWKTCGSDPYFCGTLWSTGVSDVSDMPTAFRLGDSQGSASNTPWAGGVLRTAQQVDGKARPQAPICCFPRNNPLGFSAPLESIKEIGRL